MTAPITLWRIEHPRSNAGPYSGPLSESLRDAHNCCDDHPSLRNIFGGWDGFSSRYYAACISREALDKWFRGFRAPLAREGYVVTVWECAPQHVRGPDAAGQVGFLRHCARLLREERLR